MRMANERDQAIVRSAVSDAAANLLAFVPSLGTREVLAFGEGVALPTRLKFKQLAAKSHPAEPGGHQRDDGRVARRDEDFIDTIIDRWRGATMSHKQTRSMARAISNRWRATNSRRCRSPRRRRAFRRSAAAPPPQPAPTVTPRLDPDRFRLLKNRSKASPLGQALRPQARPAAGGGKPYAARRKTQIAGHAALADRLRLVAGAEKARPRLAPVVGALGGPDEFARARGASKRPFGIVRPVGREAEFAASAAARAQAARCLCSFTKRRFQWRRFGQGRDRADRRARPTRPATSRAVRPRRRDAGGCFQAWRRRSPTSAFAMPLTNGSAADEADARMRLARLRDQVLGAAEADLEMDIVDRDRKQRCELPARVGSGRSRAAAAACRTVRLPRAQRMSLAPAEEGAVPEFARRS